MKWSGAETVDTEPANLIRLAPAKEELPSEHGPITPLSFLLGSISGPPERLFDFYNPFPSRGRP